MSPIIAPAAKGKTDRLPCVNAWPTTRKTVGPGVKHKTNDAEIKASQISKLKINASKATANHSGKRERNGRNPASGLLAYMFVRKGYHDT